MSEKQLELIQELEEKMLVVLSKLEELEALRKQVRDLEAKLQEQKQEDEKRVHKLKELVSLVETVANPEPAANVSIPAGASPVMLVQGSG
ncbi:MAG: hypothetical protein EPO11_05690 [Gammaproteobacteria bacterium]|nr:MAG: hypothetical protein EPO11_05690 [Gammaproteobacteria bacterium]